MRVGQDARQTHVSALLQTGGRAAGATRRGSQQTPTSQQTQPGSWQAFGGHLELVEAPSGRDAAHHTASGGERVGLPEPAAGGRGKRFSAVTVEHMQVKD